MCALGWVKCREHISLLVMLCIIVYVTNKAHHHLPSHTHFLSLDVNAATETLCSTLTSCLDDICPLYSRPAQTAPSNPWLSDFHREHRTRLRAAERKWRKSNDLSIPLGRNCNCVPEPVFLPLLPNQIILFQLLKLFSFVCNGKMIIFRFGFL